MLGMAFALMIKQAELETDALIIISYPSTLNLPAGPDVLVVVAPSGVQPGR
jgi:hypothetical protein